MTHRLLVTGASGQLGGYLLRELRRRDAVAVAWSGSRSGQLFGYELRPVELADRDALAGAFREAEPAVVIHAGAISRIDLCYQDPERARQVNREATIVLAELCARAGARLIYVSTDLVFDGVKGWYREEDPASPVSIYGATKAAAEAAVLANDANAVVRVSLMFGPTLVGRPSFFDRQLEALRTGNSLPLFEDEWRTPLSLITAARGLLAMADADVGGLLHLGGPERMTRLEMGHRLAAAVGKNSAVFARASQADVPAPEPRPRDVSLDSTRFRTALPTVPWPSWEEALAEFGLDAINQ
jgi:dTDP-4-dehydrorhamnose reductase